MEKLFNVTGAWGAYCTKQGVLRFYRKTFYGGVLLSRGEGEEWKNAIKGLCRLAYDNKTYLVPGVPEAKNDKQIDDAIHAFIDRLKSIDEKCAAKKTF